MKGLVCSASVCLWRADGEGNDAGHCGQFALPPLEGEIGDVGDGEGAKGFVALDTFLATLDGFVNVGDLEARAARLLSGEEARLRKLELFRR